MVFDPCRKKNVPLTPEEKVRQWFLGILNTVGGIPLTLIGTEVPLNLGDKEFRADILVYTPVSLSPRILVECKRPDVTIDNQVLSQALGYNLLLEAQYVVLTNGVQTSVWDAYEKKSIAWQDFVPAISQSPQK